MLAPERNREHIIEGQVGALNVRFMERLRSIYQVELVKRGLALRQAVTGPHTKNLTLPLWRVLQRCSGQVSASALKLLSGGSTSLAAVDDLHQATGRDLNLVVGQKHNATVGGDMQERIQGLRESVTGISQRLQAPKTWLGSESVNVLQVLCDLLKLIEQMNTQLKIHTHGLTPVPTNSDTFGIAEVTAKKLGESLREIILT